MMDQQQNVMPAMQQEAGQGPRKDAAQIVKDYVMQQTGDQKQVEQVINMLNNLSNRKMARLIQFGNTVFWALQAGQGKMEVHIFSQEPPKVLIRRIQSAYKWAKDHGFKTITTTLTDEHQVGVVKAAGLPYKMTKTQAKDGKGGMIPAFTMTMEVR